MPGIDTSSVMKAAGLVMYGSLAVAAIFGLFNIFLMWRQLGRRRFSSPAAAQGFMEQVLGAIEEGDLEAANDLCQHPSFWSRATPTLIRTALATIPRGPAKVRQAIASQFEREILSGLDHQMAWVNTVIKSAPMLGLLGTVIGMIGAFAKIADPKVGNSPAMLAGDIAVALDTTAIGLIIAIPLVTMANALSTGMRKLEDATAQQMDAVMDSIETGVQRSRRRA